MRKQNKTKEKQDSEKSQTMSARHLQSNWLYHIEDFGQWELYNFANNMIEERPEKNRTWE